MRKRSGATAAAATSPVKMPKEQDGAAFKKMKVSPYAYRNTLVQPVWLERAGLEQEHGQKRDGGAVRQGQFRPLERQSERRHGKAKGDRKQSIQQNFHGGIIASGAGWICPTCRALGFPPGYW